MSEIRILIAEDDFRNRVIYRKILQRFFPGIVIEEAEDGEEALEKIRANMPTLLILDLIMPRMNGLQVLAELKEEGRLTEMAVVVISGYPPEGRQFEEIFRYGKNIGFLQKPFNNNAFSGIIEKYLSGNEE